MEGHMLWIIGIVFGIGGAAAGAGMLAYRSVEDLRAGTHLP